MPYQSYRPQTTPGDIISLYNQVGEHSQNALLERLQRIQDMKAQQEERFATARLEDTLAGNRDQARWDREHSAGALKYAGQVAEATNPNRFATKTPSLEELMMGDPTDPRLRNYIGANREMHPITPPLPLVPPQGKIDIAARSTPIGSQAYANIGRLEPQVNELTRLLATLPAGQDTMYSPSALRYVPTQPMQSRLDSLNTSLNRSQFTYDSLRSAMGDQMSGGRVLYPQQPPPPPPSNNGRDAALMHLMDDPVYKNAVLPAGKTWDDVLNDPQVKAYLTAQGFTY